MSENLEFYGVSDVASFPLKFYCLTGCHPRAKSKLWHVYRILCLSAVFLTLVLGLVQINIALAASLNDTVEPLQGTILMFQAGTRGLILWHQQPNLEKLLRGSSRFWRETTAKSRRFLKTTKFLNHFYVSWCFWVPLSISCSPLFSDAKTMFSVYVPPGTDLKLINAVQFFCAWIPFVYLMSGDVVFSSICSEAIVQFNMLSAKLQSLESCELIRHRREVRRCIEFHNFLLDYCQTLNNFGAGIFLLQFIITMFASCVQLFILLQEGFSLVNKFKCFFFFTGQLAEFGIYCVLAEIISETVRLSFLLFLTGFPSTKIADSVYNLKWYQGEYQQDTRYFPKAVWMMIRRSRNELKFSGYGLVTINLAAFTQVFKSVLSFYAYMKAATEEPM